MNYKVGGIPPVRTIPAGTNLLISGPPMTGKYDVLLDFLGSGSDNVVVISTHHSNEEIRSAIAERRASQGKSGDIHVVDCVSQMQRSGSTNSTDTVYVSSPENLTKIGVGFTEFFTELESETARVGFHSISHLLMYADLKAVYKFLQVMTGQIKNANWISAMVYDPSMHETRTSHTVQEPFDGMIETREADGHRELRVRGLDPEPTEWEEY